MNTESQNITTFVIKRKLNAQLYATSHTENVFYKLQSLKSLI